MTPETEALLRRIERLERGRRRGLALVLGAGAVVLLTGQQGGGRVLEAERLLLKDAAGNLRAKLEVKEKDGLPALALYDKAGKHRLVLALGEKGLPVLTMLDKDGKNRAFLALGEDDLPRFGLADKDERPRLALALSSEEGGGLTITSGSGKPRLSLATDATGRPTLGIMADGEPRFTAGLGAKGEPLLSLVDQKRRLRGVFGLGESGAPALYHLDENEKSRSAFVLGEGGSPMLVFSDARSQPRVTLALVPDRAGIDLSDAEGKTRAELQLKKDGAPVLQLLEASGKAVYSKP